MTNDEVSFLYESNLIEGEPSGLALMDALSAWQFMLTVETPLSVGVIRHMHRVLMRTRNIEDAWRGRFRQQPVYIGNSQGVSWEGIHEHMAMWCMTVNNTVLDVATIKDLHITYEKIHPFIDGNGRSGRILLNWMRLRAGLPILVIKNEEKQEYYKWFRD